MTNTGAPAAAPSRGSSVTLGSASTVGRFTAPGGEVSINCAGPTTDAYVVTPLQSAKIIGGLLLLIWGLIGRRVPARP